MKSNISGRSLTKILKRVGLKLQPCFTPVVDSKKHVKPLFVLAHDLTFWYIPPVLCKTVMKVVLIPQLMSL